MDFANIDSVNLIEIDYNLKLIEANQYNQQFKL